MEPKDPDTRDGRRAALVVETDTLRLAAITQALRNLGYEVEPLSTFDEARRRLLTISDLSLLVADIRLGQFNGLHLAFRARAHHPNVRLLITDHAHDTTLETETARLGGAYLAGSFTIETLSAIVAQTEQPPAPPQTSTRRWRRTPVADVTATVGPRSARLFDISYGGLCLEFAPGAFDAAIPSTLEVEVRGLGLSLRMHPVWVRTTSSSPACLCGGELMTVDATAMMHWREFVDAHLPP